MTTDTRPETEQREQRPLYTSEPRTIYALVTRSSWTHGGKLHREIASNHVIVDSGHGPVLLDDEDGEHTYSECDYGWLTGLVTFKGALYTKLPAYDDLDEDAREEFADSMGFDFDEYEEMSCGEWRPMTWAEAQSLGLLPSSEQLASVPSQIAAAREEEREACADVAYSCIGSFCACENDEQVRACLAQDSPECVTYNRACDTIATAIRTRGESK